MKKIIGITPMIDDVNNMIWLHPGYFGGVIDAGATPIMLPWTLDKEVLKESVDMCDGILFSAGHDVLPEIYGAKVLNDSVITNREKDEMEKIIIEEAIKTNKPMLGICRGLQFMNAAMGGTLYQDLPTEHPSNEPHRQKPPYDEPAHNVKILKDTPLYEIAKKENLAVNSTHHQAVKDLAPNLKPMAYSDDDLIEAFYDPSKKYVWGVQWHPEYDYFKNEVSKMIFKKFVEAAGN